MIHVVNKGKQGEREVATAMNYCIYQVMKELDFPNEECLKGINTIQRNQIQTAIGGSDLINCYGLSIEVKRQETLSVGAWWKQCEASATKDNAIPVLCYRQNKKPWKVRTYSWFPLPEGHQMKIVSEMEWTDFLIWFKQWVTRCLQK